MNKVEYPYDTGDLLESPNTYFYSEVGGQDFLPVWQEKRQALAEKLNDVTKAENKEARDDTPFLNMADEIRISIKEGSIDGFDKLDKLLQRWEVTKKIHHAYKENWRPVDIKDYNRADHYLVFAELLDMAFNRSHKLPYFNGLLKVMDTLTVLVDRFDGQEKQRLRALIVNEKCHFDELYENISKFNKAKDKEASHAG